MVEKGKYLISQVTGEYILPSTWEWFVEPGLEINMEILVSDADRDETGSRSIIDPRRDKAGTGELIPPHAPMAPPLESSKTLQSPSDDESSVDDVADTETDYSFSDVVS